MIWAYVLLGCYILSFLIMTAIVFFERRDPVVSMAWVLCFTFLPVVGVILFFVFGHGLENHTRKKYIQKQELNNNILSTAMKKQKEPPMQAFPHINLYRYLANAGHSVCTNGNDVRIITDGEEKFSELLHDMENAKESINMLYFIIHNDNIGAKILSVLKKKANEGVEVRVLYDGFGSILTPRRAFNELRSCPNAHVAEFFPVRLFSFSKLNHRNHRKIAVIDGKTAYLGGMNIGDEYMGRKKLVWRDTHMRITGDAVAEIQKYFALDWEFSTDERLVNRLSTFFPSVKNETTDGIPMQIVASGPDSKEDEIETGMIKMLNNANKYAYIQTPYFVPEKAFMLAVTSAARSGVDVRVMIPGTPDKPYVYYSTMSYMGDLLEAGVKVYLYPGFIHSKSIAVDDEVCTIGTTNIDMRNFQLHFELNAFMYGEKICSECKRIFELDSEKCTELTKEKYEKRGLKNVMREGFFRLFSPIM